MKQCLKAWYLAIFHVTFFTRESPPLKLLHASLHMTVSNMDTWCNKFIFCVLTKLCEFTCTKRTGNAWPLYKHEIWLLLLHNYYYYYYYNHYYYNYYCYRNKFVKNVLKQTCCTWIVTGTAGSVGAFRQLWKYKLYNPSSALLLTCTTN